MTDESGMEGDLAATTPVRPPMRRGSMIIDTVVEYEHNSRRCDGDVDERIAIVVGRMVVVFECEKCGECKVVRV
jgi:hypothetical protein